MMFRPEKGLFCYAAYLVDYSHKLGMGLANAEVQSSAPNGLDRSTNIFSTSTFVFTDCELPSFVSYGPCSSRAKMYVESSIQFIYYFEFKSMFL